MAYEFSFEGKSLWALAGGSVALGLLLFVAGVLLGANWNAHDPAAPQTQAAAPQTAAPAPPTTQNASAETASATALPYVPPTEPALYASQGPRDFAAYEYERWGAGSPTYASPGQAPPGYAARVAEPAGYGEPPSHAAPSSHAPPATVREAAPPPPVDLRREAARLDAAGISADPRVVSEAEAGDEQSPGAAGYTVQVGAYAEESEARRLAGQLKTRGYRPKLFNGRDSEGHVWYVVRIGAYADAGEAAREAGDFSRRERLQAAVRPSNSL